MDDRARQQLVAIFREQGPALADDARRCEALLRDLCAGMPLEVNVLVSALRAGVPSQLLAAGDIPARLQHDRLVTQLRESQGLDADVAQWAVGAWADAVRAMAEAPEPKLQTEEIQLVAKLTAGEALSGCCKQVQHGRRCFPVAFPPGTTDGQEVRVAGTSEDAAGSSLTQTVLVIAVQVTPAINPLLEALAREDLLTALLLWDRGGAEDASLQPYAARIEAARDLRVSLPARDALRTFEQAALSRDAESSSLLWQIVADMPDAKRYGVAVKDAQERVPPLADQLGSADPVEAFREAVGRQDKLLALTIWPYVSSHASAQQFTALMDHWRREVEP